MTSWVNEDAEAWVGMEFGLAGARGENLFLGGVEIVDVEVEMGLLGPLHARPHRRRVVGCEPGTRV